MFENASDQKLLFRSCLSALFLVCLLAQALAQGQEDNLWITGNCSTEISLAWTAAPGAEFYDVSIQTNGPGTELLVGVTTATSFTIIELEPNTEYEIFVDLSATDHYQITASTDESTCEKPTKRAVVADIFEPEWKPMPVTCQNMPPHVIVSGYVMGTQCQLVNEAGIGQMDVIKRGVIDAVDVWNFVPEEVEICFRESGWVVFLDAGYMPRMAMELEHTYINGLTCATIDRAGTVALVASAAPPDPQATSEAPAESDAPAQSDAPPTLPFFEAIPLIDCQIKLVETLFLRETPGGEIIGLVWLNSEVPAFEINGYWYKVEFEGVTGYISRYHRKVLRGGCG